LLRDNPCPLTLSLSLRNSYNNHADNVAAFPTGADYGKTASTWLAAVRAAHPAAAISVVGVPSYRVHGDARIDGWNAGLFSALQGGRPGDGVSMHEYDPTNAGTGATFTAADVKTLLATAFTVAARVNSTDVPAWAGIWVTEYNLLFSDKNPKPDVPAFGTWAHGLFLAAETLLFLRSPPVARGRVNKHCIGSYAYSGALFSDTTSFDFPYSPDSSLPTVQWAVSGPGAALALLGAASRAATAAAPLDFSPNPPVQPPAGPAFPSLLGAAFTGGARGAAALVLNLADAPAALSQGLAGYSSFTTLAAAGGGAPTAGINDQAKQLARSTGAVGASVALPAYSVTLLQA
jgi:hypothetical protein